jgi:hypothetical protein
MTSTHTQTLSRIGLCLLCAALVGAPSACAAPEKRVHIGYVYPAGGLRGTNFVVKVGGDNISDAIAAIISGKGITAQVVMTNDAKNGKSDAPKKTNKKNQSVIDEIVTLKITITPDAEIGDHELRLVVPDTGPSDPLVFQVGQFPEVLESEPNDKAKDANPLPPLPVTVNGQIQSGDVDMFKFNANKGQHLVVEVSARALFPYMADAVPGWFKAVISLSDSQGREVAYVDSYRFNPDPVLFYDVPSNSEYRLVIRDSIYRGRADFVYRVKIGEFPFITDIFPLGAARQNTPVPAHLSGINLPVENIQVGVNQNAPAVLHLTVTNKDGWVSTPVSFAIGSLLEVLEDESAARQTNGQSVTMPVVINGRIRTPGESRYFRFAGKKSQPVCISTMARRLGSPLDSFIVLLNPRGEKIAENDDIKDKAEGLLTHVADSMIMRQLPEDGTYTLRLYDTQGKGGDAFAYRLSIASPVPDFELRATPAALCVAKDASVPFTTHIIRKCGFTNEVRLTLDAASAPGCTLDGGVILEGTDKLRMTFSTASNASHATIFPAMHGTAIVNGKSVSHPVVPAEDRMQAFIYQHLVPAQMCAMTITTQSAPFRVTPDLGTNGFLALPFGKETSFTVSVTRSSSDFDGPIRLQLEDPPKGITLRKPMIPADKDSTIIIIRADDTVDTKLRSNLIITGIMTLDAPASTNAVPTNTVPTNVVSVVTNAIPTNATPPRVSAPATTNVPTLASTNAPASTNAAPAEIKNADSQKKVPPRERLTITLPAIPFRIIPKPAEKPHEKSSEVKKADADKNNKK